MRQPPKALPAAFRPIWDALDQADESAVSRRALARDLRVSSVTLHRLLVTGDVPDLRRASVREQRAWTRTLSRIALRLGHDPRSWIDAVGIPWSDAIAGLVDQAGLRPERVPLGSSSKPPRPKPATAKTGWPEPSNYGQARPLRVGIASIPGWDDPGWDESTLPERSGFLSRLAHRLARNLFRGGRSVFRAMSPEATQAALARNQLDLAVGLWDTADARRTGVGMVPIPGLTLPLRMLTVGSHPQSPLEVHGTPSTRFLCLPASSALEYLLVHCEVAPDRIEELTSDALRPDVLADRMRGEGSVLVLDARAAWSIVGGAIDKEWREVPGIADEDSLATLCVGLPPASESLVSLVQHTLEVGWIAANPTRTASLYADLLEAPGHDLEPSPGSRPLLVSLAKATTLHPLSRGVEESRGVRFLERLHAALRERVSDEASLALLPPWPDEPDRTGDTTPQLLRPPQCQSCSVSLNDYGGVSDHYCRYCSDEDGTLRPLEEVQADIRRWMLRWQKGADESNIDERVRHFMRAMPAWADRV
ncbi:MAG: hypothetical protein R3E97_06080 [Candidatus Eisenbacteria bacterium]